MDDFEKLITAGYSGVDNAELVLQRLLAQIYLDAYKQAASDLAALMARFDGQDMTLAMARRKDQLGAMMRGIESEYIKLTGEAVKLTGENIAFNFNESAKSFFYGLDQATDPQGYTLGEVGGTFYDIPDAAVRASVMSEFSGLTFIQTFKKNMEGQLWQIQATITRGIATGSTYDKIAKELKGLFDKGYWQAMRVVRTEAGRAYTEGFLYGYEKGRAAGIRMNKMWVAALDKRTRDTHAAADGQFADLTTGLFYVGTSSGPGPGLMDEVGEVANCRCRSIAVLEGYPPDNRRDPNDGTIKEYFTFSQWKNKTYG